MDNLKFRAWDKALKKWAFTEFHLLGSVMLFDELSKYCLENHLNKTFVERLKDIIITQFSGLKDFKGVDIYEGDLYKTLIGGRRDSNSLIYTVYFVSGAFVGGLTKDKTHPLGWKMQEDEEAEPDGPEDFAEVIGNIFEGPK